MSQIDLTNLKEAETFYDQRYQDGYMEEWDSLKKQKVIQVIQLLNLPVNGKLIDFGCGNGVFTNLIKKILPSWDVYGVQISKTAVQNASIKFPYCNFLHIDDISSHLGTFDFLFSHHVLEHVQNIKETFQQINAYLKPTAQQLHILPCGNSNSYEYNICKLIINGINEKEENRFYFEEPGHLRRLTTEQFSNYEKEYGFLLSKHFYSNQYYGAIDWITKSSPSFVLRLTNPKKSINPASSTKLNALRLKLLPLTILQFPYTKYWAINSKWGKKTKDYILLSILFIPSIFSKIVSNYVTKKSCDEWEKNKEKINGSEMFLHYIRVQ